MGLVGAGGSATEERAVEDLGDSADSDWEEGWEEDSVELGETVKAAEGLATVAAAEGAV